jgi:hypothetical protein
MMLDLMLRGSLNLAVAKLAVSFKIESRRKFVQPYSNMMWGMMRPG